MTSLRVSASVQLMVALLAGILSACAERSDGMAARRQVHDRATPAAVPNPEAASSPGRPASSGATTEHPICARVRPCCHAYALAQFGAAEAQNNAAPGALEHSACEHAPEADEDACAQFLEGLVRSLGVYRLPVPSICEAGGRRPQAAPQYARNWANEVRGRLPDGSCAPCRAPCRRACFSTNPTLVVQAAEPHRVRILVHSEGDAVLRVISSDGEVYVDDTQGLDPVVDLNAHEGEYSLYVGRHIESAEERADSIDPDRADVAFVLRTTEDSSATTESLQ